VVVGTIIWFWAIPVLALVPALVWASWAVRKPHGPDMLETTERYAQWQAILGRVQQAPAERRAPGEAPDPGPADPDSPGPARRSVS
jgi:hypothetical protein